MQEEEEEDEDEEDLHEGFETETKENEYKAIQQLQKEILDVLPRIQEDGTFKKDGAPMSMKEAQTLVSRKLPMRFAGGVPNIAPSAEDRALRAGPDSGPWTDEQLLDARAAMQVSDFAIRPKLYELYAYNDLKEIPIFMKGNKGGILFPHHACGATSRRVASGHRMSSKLS